MREVTSVSWKTERWKVGAAHTHLKTRINRLDPKPVTTPNPSPQVNLVPLSLPFELDYVHAKREGLTMARKKTTLWGNAIYSKPINRAAGFGFGRSSEQHRTDNFQSPRVVITTQLLEAIEQMRRDSLRIKSKYKYSYKFKKRDSDPLVRV